MISLPLKPKVIGKGENTAVFEIEALYPGYGVTVGNALRRVLLSSLEGGAVTQVKIKGVQGQFSTIPGILEDVILIMLNLKQLRFKVYSTEPQKGILKAKGEKKVKGGDFELPSQVELINKDCHIATLTAKSAELEMEIQIEKGVGYEPVERRKELSKGKLEIGVIPLDAIFTPVRRVSFRTENMRVGDRTDFDKLNLEIETDGTISPEEAFYRASEILVNHFSLLYESLQSKEKISAIKEEDFGERKIEEMKFSTRTLNLLLDNNIKTVGKILEKGEKKISNLEGMGEKGIKEIKRKLKKLGLELR